MTKYSSEFKLKVVKYCLEEHHRGAEKYFGANHEEIRQWVKKYQEHGAIGLIKNNQKYDGKFKQDVVEYMHRNHLSLEKTCVKFNLGNHNIVGKWERICYEGGPQALYEKRRGRSKNVKSKPKK